MNGQQQSADAMVLLNHQGMVAFALTAACAWDVMQADSSSGDSTPAAHVPLHAT